jgi:AcrR family transcriptional regulator
MLEKPLEEKLDRRKQRTRRMLRDALLVLIVEKGYDDLSVQDITEKDDLRRATFYLHYADKDELLAAVLREIFDELVKELEPLIQTDGFGGKTQTETFAVMYRHLAANSRLYQIILAGQGGAAIGRSIRQYLAGHVTAMLKLLPAAQITMPIDVLANYMAGAELSLMTWWLERGQPYPVERMAMMTQQLVLHGIMKNIEPQR